MGIAYYLCSSTHAATKHLTRRCAGNDIHVYIISVILSVCAIICSTGLVGSPSLTAFCTSKDRVWRSIAATIQFTNNQRFTSVLIHIHRNRAPDVTTLVVTAKDAPELTAGHGQGDITVNRCFLCTAIDSIHEVSWHTFQNDINIALYVCMTACTVDIADIQFFTAVCHDFILSSCANICAFTDITSGVAAAIDIIDITAQKFSLSLTGTILL